VDPHAKLLARRHTAWRLVGRVAVKRAVAFRAAGVGSEGEQVQAEQLLEDRLKFVDFGVYFEEQSGFGLRVEVAGGHLLAQLQGLSVDRGKFVGHREASLTLASGFGFLKAAVDTGETGREPRGRVALHLFRQPRNAGVDPDLLIVEEVGIVAAGSSFSGCDRVRRCRRLRGGRHRPQMIA